jgi:hypothetical protein
MSATFGPSISSLVNMLYSCMLGTHSKRVFCHLRFVLSVYSSITRLNFLRPSPTSFSFRQHRVSCAFCSIIVSNMPIFLNPDRGTVPPSSRLHMLHTWPCSTPSPFGTLLTIQRSPNVNMQCSVTSTHIPCSHCQKTGIPAYVLSTHSHW